MSLWLMQKNIDHLSFCNGTLLLIYKLLSVLRCINRLIHWLILFCLVCSLMRCLIIHSNVPRDSACITDIFNFHLNNPLNHDARKFWDLETFGLSQHVMVPTHTCGHTLDLIILRSFEWYKGLALLKLKCVIPNFDHITPLLVKLHWLPVYFSIQFRILLLIFKALQ